MEEWAAAFDSWDVCDQVTSNLFDKTPFAYDKVEEWSGARGRVGQAGGVRHGGRPRRAGQGGARRALPRDPRARARARPGDGRNFVKKAVNWALRNIGKRNAALHAAALETAAAILAEADARAAADRRDPAARSTRWVARDALRELRFREGAAPPGLCERRAVLARRRAPRSTISVSQCPKSPDTGGCRRGRRGTRQVPTTRRDADTRASCGAPRGCSATRCASPSPPPSSSASSSSSTPACTRSPWRASTSSR